jgi:hypothetical protein
MRIFTLQAFDQVGELGSDGARLTAVLARFGGQGIEAAAAIAERPLEQSIDRNGYALGIGDVVLAGGNLLGAAGEFTAGKGFEH